MILAAELLGGTFHMEPGRGRRVQTLGEWPPETVERTCDLVECRDLREVIPTSQTVKELCLELGAGITSGIIAGLAGISLKAASTYLTRLERSGVLEVQRVIRARGRPTRVLRVRAP